MKPETRIRDPETYLQVSQSFLRYRRFLYCRNYAIRAQESSKNHHAAAQILAVADVLSASEALVNQQQKKADWYSVLQVSRYSKDSTLIRTKFEKLFQLLNPNQNKFIYSSEAFMLVIRAWSVLSNPFRKSEFDNELRNLELGVENSGESEGNCVCLEGKETFWTICPYCYFVYEYEKDYEDCFLSCHNEECKRSFHGVTISSPPSEVVERGWYWCYQTFPFRFEGNEGDGLSRSTKSGPGLTQLSRKRMFKEKNALCEKGNEGNKCNYIEISDHSDESSDEIDRISRVCAKNLDYEKVQTEEVKHAAKSVEKEASDIRKPVTKRKKSVPNNSKKLMGRGIKVNKDKLFVLQSIGGLNLDIEATEDEEDEGDRGIETGTAGVE